MLNGKFEFIQNGLLPLVTRAKPFCNIENRSIVSIDILDLYLISAGLVKEAKDIMQGSFDLISYGTFFFALNVSMALPSK